MSTLDDSTLAITLPELAAAIGANVRSLRNAFYLHQNQFPPAIYLPGTRGPRFLTSDVRNWLEAKKTQRSTSPLPPPIPKAPGRPRKAPAGKIARARLMRKGSSE